jgi:hypothetical protein
MNFNQKVKTPTKKSTKKISISIEKRDLEKERILADLVFKFNMVITGMIKHITEYNIDSSMSRMEMILTNIIEKSPEEPISCFLLNVYKNDCYRVNILKQNDKFFMEEEYDEFTKGYSDRSFKLFEFKYLWKHIDMDTKKFIKKSMMALVKICQKYILSL